jgi:hypothetical protein
MNFFNQLIDLTRNINLIFRVLAESVDAILTDSRSVFVAVDAAV